MLFIRITNLDKLSVVVKDKRKIRSGAKDPSTYSDALAEEYGMRDQRGNGTYI